MDGVGKTAIIGAGPAGLFASWLLLKEGFTVDLYDRNSQAGLKFLLAGASGLNITSLYDSERFHTLYGSRADFFYHALKDFSARDTIKWLNELGEETFTGSGKKVFPKSGNTRDLRDRWLGEMEKTGRFFFHGEHVLVDWLKDGLHFVHHDSLSIVNPSTVLFSLGGASWPGTGSDGSWSVFFQKRGIPLKPFKPMNCAFLVDWTPLLLSRFMNSHLKNIRVIYGGESRRGDLLIRETGLEGGPLYHFSREIVNRIEREGRDQIHIDLTPDLSYDKVLIQLARERGRKSYSSFLKRELNLSPLKIALLYETRSVVTDLPLLARRIKGIPLTLTGTDKLEKAISTMGGVDFSSLDENLMFKEFPGFFTAGEMADWECPTGGFLLQGCFTTAFRAVKGIRKYYENQM